MSSNAMKRLSQPFYRKWMWVFSLLIVTTAGEVSGTVATGGAFTLERTLFYGTQQIATDGNQFSLNGSIGEGFSHATGLNQSVDGPMKRLYDGFLGPLKIDPSVQNLLSTEGGNVQITIPGSVIPQPYEPMIGIDPTNSPIAADPSTIQQATQKLVNLLGPSVTAPLAAVELQILMEDNSLFSEEMESPSHCNLTYSDRGDGGNVLIVNFDEASGEWVEILPSNPASSINTAGFASTANSVASVSHARAGILAVFQQGPTDVGRAYAFPVPWRPHAANPALYGTLGDGITFTEIPTVGSIGIYNIAGELVREITIPPGSSQFRWDGKTTSGKDVASGVYIWTVEANGNRKTGKLMVIR